MRARRRRSPRHRALALVVALAIASMLAGCARVGNVVSDPDQITDQDVLRVLDRDIRLAAVDVKAACDGGLVSAARCEAAKMAIVGAARAYNKLLGYHEAGLPLAAGACQAALATIKRKLAEAAP